MWHQHAATPRRRVVAVREYQITCQIRRRCFAVPRVVPSCRRRGSRTPAAGSRPRPAGSCAVPPRVACAAAAAVGPGVVTGPARRDSTHRDAAHAACRPVPLRAGGRPPSAGPAATVDAAIGFEYCMRILNEQQVGVPIRRETESDLYVLAPTNPARDRRDGKYDTRSNPNITLPPRLPETTSGRARYPRTHLAVTPLTRAGRAADGRRAPRRCAGRVGV